MRSHQKIALLYLLVGSFWILASDSIISTLFGSQPLVLQQIQLYKGWLFIFITGGLLYLLLKQTFDKRDMVEQQVRSQERDFEYLFQNNPCPMWVYDSLTLRFLDVNEPAIKEYGYSREEFLAMKITEIRPSEEVGRLLDYIATDRPVYRKAGIWRHRRKDGTLLDVEITSHGLSFANKDAILVVVQDVTERRIAQEALKHTMQTLQALIAASPAAIIASDAQGLITVWNAAAEVLYGWKADEVIGKTVALIPPELREEGFGLLTRIQSGETMQNVELERMRKDGSRIEISFTAAPVYDDQGKIQALMSISTDIGEYKRLQSEARERERLQLLLDKELELRDVRNRFMSMLSHEFRSPLSAIFTAADMLDHYADRITADARQQRYNDIREQVKRLIELLDDFLTMMRSERVGLEFTPTLIDLVEFCRALMTEFQTEDHHPFLLDAKVDQAPVQGDEKLLRHALGNLFTNAVKYSPQGGAIKVEIWDEDKKFCVQVADEGIGIPESDQATLFDAFKRGNNVGKIPGTGLGLAIARQSVELHNGTISLKSTPGSGSTFTIRIPAAPEMG